MNTSRLSKCLVMLLCVIGTAAYGQKKAKSYTELFNVTPETILDINTSNTDITFETWDKDQIEIEATIEIEGASEEEAKGYLENELIQIVGNSKKISVSTPTEKAWLFKNGPQSVDFPQFDKGLRIQLDDLSNQLSLFSDDAQWIDLSMIDDMPPMPPIPHTNFDYEAFERDGEKYMEKWQKEFKKGFGKEYQQRMEKWRKERDAQLKKRNAARAEQLEKRAQERSERMKERFEEQEKRLKERQEERVERLILLEKRKEDSEKLRNEIRLFTSRSGDDSVRYHLFSNDNSHKRFPNSFYFSSGGKNKNYKVKKTLQIRMPKGNKMKMKVRHGEVTLAENTKNMNANLSYSTLRAFIIDGEETTVVASYSPVSVQKWNLGQLQADYSEAVNLEEVVNLKLSTTSSDVTIAHLLDKAFIQNDYGPLTIHSVSDDFTDLDISLQNAEVQCNLPDTPFTIYVNGTSSEFSYPRSLQLVHTENGQNAISKGYHINKNGGKSIVINSKYSEVNLD